MSKLPEYRSDNSPPFQGQEFEEFCSVNGIKHVRTTPKWPQANEKMENFNRNLKRLIQKSFVSKSDLRADLNCFLRAYRSSPHGSTKVAPADLMFIASKLPMKMDANMS